MTSTKNELAGQAQDIIARLGLVSHPEGGFYREMYRADESTAGGDMPERYGGARCSSTAIYYMLTPDTFSTMHRLKSDEIFHFYLGDPVEMLQIDENGSGKVITLGQDLAAGQMVQSVVRRGLWFGARLCAGGSFALLGCTVAPGFEFADYEEATCQSLLQKCVQYSDLIKALTRP